MKFGENNLTNLGFVSMVTAVKGKFVMYVFMDYGLCVHENPL